MTNTRGTASNRINLGIIGCGIAARELHLPALRSLTDRFEIKAVCNHTEPKARSFSRLIGGVPFVLDYHDLLARPDIEAVDIVLPIDLNYKVTLDALKAGKHVFLEKPLAANLRDARKLLSLERRHREVTLMAENYRYQAVYRRVAYHITRKAIGKPYAAIWSLFSHLTTKNKYARTLWRVHHKYPGGFLTDAGVHNMAALRLLFGELTVVDAFAKGINHGIGRTDTLSARFRSAQNTEILFNLYFSTAGHTESSLLIFGTEGTIEVRENRISLKRTGNPVRQEAMVDDGGFKAEFMDFFDSIRNHRKPLSPFAEGYRDLHTILAALDAAGK